MALDSRLRGSDEGGNGIDVLNNRPAQAARPAFEG